MPEYAFFGMDEVFFHVFALPRSRILQYVAADGVLRHVRHNINFNLIYLCIWIQRNIFVQNNKIKVAQNGKSYNYRCGRRCLRCCT